MLSEKIDYLLGLPKGSDEGDHYFDVGEAHLIAHPFHCAALHFESLGEIWREIACCTAETQHGVLFVRLVTRTTDQLFIFVRFEVRQSNDDRPGPERRRNGCHPLSQLVDVEGFRRSMPARDGFDGFF